MDIIAATYTTYRTTTTYTSPYASSSSVDAGSLGAFFAGFAIFFIISLVISLLINMALTWGVYKKGGYKGWEGIIPFYNMYCLYKMADVSMALFVIGIFIPVVNICMYLELAKKFGKDTLYGLGLFLLNPIFMAILGYGAAEYEGGEAKEEAKPAAKSAPKKVAAKSTAKKSPAKKSTK